VKSDRNYNFDIFRKITLKQQKWSVLISFADLTVN